MRVIEDYSRLNVITSDLSNKIQELSSINSPQAIEMSNRIQNGLLLIQNIQENLSQGRPFIMSPEEKKLLDMIKEYYFETEVQLYGKKFEVSDSFTHNIQ